MLAWFDGHPLLSDIGFQLYNAFQPEQVVVPVILVLASQVARAQTAILAGLIGLVLTHAIAYAMPAAGAYGYYAVTAAQHPGISLVSAGLTVTELELLRTGATIYFDQRTQLGLITFPSYHALMAVVFAWALWSVPYVRWPGLAINAGMFLATPLHGSHHICDTIAGGVLAIFCVLAARAILAQLDAAFATRHLRATRPDLVRRLFRVKSHHNGFTWRPAR
jgi:hypothetical protein